MVTRLALLADLHGNLPALEAVAADLASLAVDHVVVAGDLINLGPFPKEVVEFVLAHQWSVLRGNHEYYLLDYQTPRAPPAWSDPMRWSLLHWTFQQLGPGLRQRIAAWPDRLSLRFPDGPPILVVHGVPASPWTGISPNARDDEIAVHLRDVAEPLVIVGHTHLPLDRSVDRWRVLNPGSAGNPADGDPRVSYLILEAHDGEWTPCLRRVAYDRERLFLAFERREVIRHCGVMGYLAREEFRSARLEIVPFLRWHDATCPECPLTADLLAAYARVDRDVYRGRDYQIDERSEE